MERAKKELEKAYQSGIEEGLSKEEALARAVVEVRGKHEESELRKAFEELVKEIADSYSLKNLTEVDPLVALSEALYEEYEILKAKLKALFERE